MPQVGHRLARGGKQSRAFQHHVGARGGGDSLLVRPAVARFDQAQVGQAAIEHGPRHNADVHAELRAHQDDRRAAGHGLAPAIGTSHQATRIWLAGALSRSSL